MKSDRRLAKGARQNTIIRREPYHRPTTPAIDLRQLIQRRHPRMLR